MKLVIATTNQGKYKEIKAFLDGKIPGDVELLSLRDFPAVPDVEENAKTVKGNALKKALTYARVLGYPVIAEDSALEVDALGGKPGVFSARYGRNDVERISRLLRELNGVPLEKRTARFRCIMVLALPSGEKFISQGVVNGIILDSPRGSGGFGYDPVFLYPPFGKTFAEISPAEKLSVSHRGKALSGILKFIKFVYLGEILSSMGRVAVSFSGGVDSSFLGFCAKMFSPDPVLLFIDTPLISEQSRLNAFRIAQDLGIRLFKVDLDLLSIEELRGNGKLRCYHCKRAMYTLSRSWAERRGLIILDGTNFSDLSEDRPGLRALKELEIISPLKMAKFTKNEIRELARFFKLFFWNEPSSTCLATRVRTGIPIVPSILRRIERAEAYLKLIGFSVVRVRVDLPGFCRIEIGQEELKKALNSRLLSEIALELKKVGFKRVSLDLEGYGV
ncbi:MAG: ATP-dependent sacrificial sulfur transferase LarE [Synergistetes bacterium]|nr:ATP-dependent sacrificial sulfur transferase LarE [Synergistota bacterium]